MKTPIMTRPRPVRRRSEEGFLLVAVMFLLAILVIAMAIAAPKIKEDIQRDRDVETMHRGKQYIRAVQLYYRKFHAYPPNMDALVKTNEIRFLRKKYIDPTTGKDEWRPIPFGQNKAPTFMGFFGQAMGVTSVAGTGPSGGNGVAGASSIGGSPFGQNGSSSSSFGSSGSGSNSFGSSSFGSNPGSTSAFGSNPGSSSGTGTGFGATGSGSSDPNGGGAAGGPGNGFSGQTFGGAGIMGFAPGSPKPSILVYKTKTHYNEWEFVYDPASEQMMLGGGGAGLGGQPATGLSNPVGGNGLGNNGTGLNPPGGTTQTPIIAPQPQQ